VIIPYRGRLADASGLPIADGAYDFAFALYEDESGGEPLWSEAQEGVLVTNGAFVAPLGSVQPLVPDVLGGEERWLAVAVRGPGEAGFTALTPRQHLSAALPAAPASPTNGAACPHDHWGEDWTGSGQGLYLGSSDGFGLLARGYPAIYAESGLSQVTAPTGSIGVYGYAADTGVYGWGTNFGVGGVSTQGIGVNGVSDQGIGVKGVSTTKDGVVGQTAGSGKSGVYGSHTDTGYGVAGRSKYGCGVHAAGQDAMCGDLQLGGSAGIIVADGAPDADLWIKSNRHVLVRLDTNNDDSTFGFLVEDWNGNQLFSVDNNGDLTASGSKAGYVVDIAQNDDSVSLERGDVVIISGAGPAVLGQNPVIKVRRATAAQAGAVIGVVAKRYIPVAAQSTDASAGRAQSSEDNAIAPEGYLTVVTLGSFEAIKVDASHGAIQPGDLLVASPNPGHAMRATSPEPGTIVGKALGALDASQGTGVIPVVVTLH
jgi:hypothetical protein